MSNTWVFAALYLLFFLLLSLSLSLCWSQFVPSCFMLPAVFHHTYLSKRGRPSVCFSGLQSSVHWGGKAKWPPHGIEGSMILETAHWAHAFTDRDSMQVLPKLSCFMALYFLPYCLGGHMSSWGFTQSRVCACSCVLCHHVMCEFLREHVRSSREGGCCRLLGEAPLTVTLQYVGTPSPKSSGYMRRFGKQLHGLLTFQECI